VTLFVRLVEASQRVGATSARLAKVRELAACLREFDPSEIEIGVHYLAGDTPQGRFGIGYSLLREVSADAAAPTPNLSVCDVDQRLGEIADMRGPGATTRASALCVSSFREPLLASRNS
jgi:DNA ligase 1